MAFYVRSIIQISRFVFDLFIAYTYTVYDIHMYMVFRSKPSIKWIFLNSLFVLAKIANGNRKHGLNIFCWFIWLYLCYSLWHGYLSSGCECVRSMIMVAWSKEHTKSFIIFEEVERILHIYAIFIRRFCTTHKNSWNRVQSLKHQSSFTLRQGTVVWTKYVKAWCEKSGASEAKKKSLWW